MCIKPKYLFLSWKFLSNKNVTDKRESSNSSCYPKYSIPACMLSRIKYVK